jgi:hypothetical protein
LGAGSAFFAGWDFGLAAMDRLFMWGCFPHYHRPVRGATLHGRAGGIKGKRGAEALSA